MRKHFKYAIVATHDHTGRYMWDENDTTVYIMSDDNDTIIDTEDNQSGVETDQNHNYIQILEFGIENAPDIYYTD